MVSEDPDEEHDGGKDSDARAPDKPWEVVERGRGPLTEGDRNYLLDPEEEGYDGPAEYNQRRRIRERLENAVYDFALALEYMEPRDRERLFEAPLETFEGTEFDEEISDAMRQMWKARIPEGVAQSLRRAAVFPWLLQAHRTVEARAGEEGETTPEVVVANLAETAVHDQIDTWLKLFDDGWYGDVDVDVSVDRTKRVDREAQKEDLSGIAGEGTGILSRPGGEAIPGSGKSQLLTGSYDREGVIERLAARLGVEEEEVGEVLEEIEETSEEE